MVKHCFVQHAQCYTPTPTVLFFSLILLQTPSPAPHPRWQVEGSPHPRQPAGGDTTPECPGEGRMRSPLDACMWNEAVLDAIQLCNPNPSTDTNSNPNPISILCSCVGLYFRYECMLETCSHSLYFRVPIE